MSFSFVKKKQPNSTIQNSNQLPKPQHSNKKGGFSFIRKNDNNAVSQNDNPIVSNNNKNTQTNQNTLDNLLNNDQLFLSAPPAKETKQEDKKPSLLDFDLNTNNTHNQSTKPPLQEKEPKKQLNINQDAMINLNEHINYEKIEIDNTLTFNEENSNQNKLSVNIKKEKVITCKKGFGFVKKDKVLASSNQKAFNQSNIKESTQLNPIIKEQSKSNSPIKTIKNEQKNDIKNNTIEIQKEDNINNNDNNILVKTNNNNQKPLTKEKPKYKNQYIKSSIPPQIKFTKELGLQQLEKQKLKNKDTYLNLITNIHCLKLKIKSKQEELTKMNKEKEKLIKDEQIAVENNDYDTADKIETQIKNINLKIETASSIIVESKRDLMSNREKEISFKQISLKEIESLKEKFNQMQSDLLKKLEVFNSKDIVNQKNEKLKLEKVKDKLQYLKENIDNEKDIIEEEENKINESIKEQSKEVFNQLDNYQKEKDKIQKEIDEIKKQLQQKQICLNEIEKNIKEKETEIKIIKENFKEEYQNIENKKVSNAESKKDYDKQLEDYNKNIEILNTKELNNNKYVNNLNNEIAVNTTEINKLQSIIEQSKEDIAQSLNNFQKENEFFLLISSFDKEIDENMTNIKDYKEKIQQLKVDNKFKEGENAQIDLRIPALEEEKKTCVQRKSFKEAGKVSNELKASLQKKSNNIKAIEENNKNITIYEKQVIDFENNLISLDKQKKEKERDYNIARYESLSKYLIKLEDFLKENQSNNDLIEEIIFTKEEIATLKQLDNSNETKENIKNQKEQSKEISLQESQTPIVNSKIEENNDTNNKMTKEEIEAKIQSLNTELEDAVNVENYELADTLQQQIDSFTSQLTNLK